jgi:DNA polymerase-1
MAKPTSTLLLVDGYALLYRAFYAYPPLTTPKGEPIGAVYGFSRILLAALRSLKPTHVAVCFDLDKPTFRHQTYAMYKATRQKMPDELSSQISRMHQVIDYLEFPIYAAEGFEADDVIATIADQAAAQGEQVLILSGDQDLLQLVTPEISLYSPAVGKKAAVLYTPEKVQETYGFPPKQIVDYKALAGDSSDNIPGVTGIGDVTAKQLLAQYGTLEQLYDCLDTGHVTTLKPAVLQKLTAQRDQAWDSYRLATLRKDAPVEYSAERCKLELQNPERLVELFHQLGFRSLIAEMPKSHYLLSEAADVFAQAMATSAGSDPAPAAPNPRAPSPDADQATDPLASDTPAFADPATYDNPETAGLSPSEQVDKQLEPVLRKMEQAGVKIDLAYLRGLEEEFNREIAQARDQLQETAGQPFNPDSPSQVAHILYEVLHIPTQGVRKGKTGYTTDAATLQYLAHTYPIATQLLQYREVTKLQNTYVRPIQELADPRQRLHTSYAPDTSTGRISSKNPNLQNIPIKSERGRRIRKAFIAETGYRLVAADYSQIELRIAAHLSGDPAMQEAFRNGGDFHAATAERMKVDRRTAKVINFSILYGKGPYGFSQDLHISLAEARQYIDQYYDTYKKLREYLDRILADVRQNGYAETLYGRRRYFPEINSRAYQRRSAAEREAMNLPIQGTAADILKLAMCELDTVLTRQLPQARLILTVHDELVVEVLQAQVELAAALLRQTMTDIVTLAVPLEVSVAAGDNWADMQEIPPSSSASSRKEG